MVDVEYGLIFFFSSRRRHTRYWRDWSSDVCSSDLRLMRGVLDEMRAESVREVELDVAAMRRDAIGLYTRLGYRRMRSYLNLAATGREIGLDRVSLPANRTIVAGSEMQLIEAFARIQGAEPTPCWDRSLASLLAYPDGYISRLVEGEREVAL